MNNIVDVSHNVWIKSFKLITSWHYGRDWPIKPFEIADQSIDQFIIADSLNSIFLYSKTIWLNVNVDYIDFISFSGFNEMTLGKSQNSISVQ